MEHWIWLGLEHSSLVDWGAFHHNSGLSRFGATIISGLTLLLAVNLGH